MADDEVIRAQQKALEAFSNSSIARDSDGRRTLLAVFIHGFMGNDTSFQRFPAHLHAVLSAKLINSHIVHVKVYPRYRSRKAIEFARDDFSRWLEPHESPDTDVVLLGHSLGGILAAEIALSPPTSYQRGQQFRHRILGTISFDTPFLGLHPGVVVSGISSLFRKTPKSSISESDGLDDANSSGSPTVLQEVFPDADEPVTKDPNFNPVFANDVILTDRKGWNNFLHFVNKHSNGLQPAIKQYLMSHLQHGGCLADYSELRARYTKLRALENANGYASPGQGRRLRFINYYTVSTGRPKEKKSKDDLSESVESLTIEEEASPEDQVEEQELTLLPPQEWIESPRSSIEAPSFEDALEEPLSGSISKDSSTEDLPQLDEISLDVALHMKLPPGNSRLPGIPHAPSKPDSPNFDSYPDTEVRKVVERHYKRSMDAYELAIKQREAALQDRRKLLRRLEKKESGDKTKQEKAERKRAAKEEKEEKKRAAKEASEERKRAAKEAKEVKQRKESKDRSASLTSDLEKEKKPKAKKFCMLPARMFGGDDKCWVPVQMEGVDEVGAHCGLFFAGPHYGSLVGDVAHRIEEWLAEDASRRNAGDGR